MATKLTQTPDGLVAVLPVPVRTGQPPRKRPYIISSSWTKSGAWLCCLHQVVRRGQQAGSEYTLPNYSVLVRRDSEGRWGCSCMEPDCVHMNAARAVYQRELETRYARTS